MTDILVTIDRPDSVSTQNYGDGEDWDIFSGERDPGGRDSGIQGVDDVVVDVEGDTQRQQGPWDIAGFQREAAPQITIPLYIAGTVDSATAMGRIVTLRAAWRVLEDPADMATLTIMRWGYEVVFSGKPLGVKFSEGSLLSGHATAVCTFKPYAEISGS